MMLIREVQAADEMSVITVGERLRSEHSTQAMLRSDANGRKMGRFPSYLRLAEMRVIRRMTDRAITRIGVTLQPSASTHGIQSALGLPRVQSLANRTTLSLFNKSASFAHMSVVDDVERVQEWVATQGTEGQRAWFYSWAESFRAAVDAEDEDTCEDLHIALIAFERLELRTSGRFLTLDEVIVSLGFDPAEFREG